MAKFLFMTSYTVDGFKGVLKDGGSSRVDAARKMIESAGGRLESFYFTFSERDTHVVCDLPDQEAVAAVALAVGAGGAPTKVISLLTPEQVDEAARRKLDYRPPGA